LRYILEKGYRDVYENFIENAKEIFESISPNFLKAFGPWILKHPKHLFRYKKLLNAYKKAEHKRSGYMEKGVLGGEPFIFDGLLDICGTYKDRFF
jgi:hypothetical protein